MNGALSVVVAALLLGVACGGGAADVAPPATRPAEATAVATPVTSPAGFEAWARPICEIIEGWSQAIAAVAEPGDPTQLAVEERKARSARISAVEIEASRRAVLLLSRVIPPPEAAEYQRAVSLQFAERAQLVEAIEPRIQQATTAAGIDALNREYQEGAELRRRTVTAASQFLPPDAIAALTGASSCGYLTR